LFHPRDGSLHTGTLREVSAGKESTMSQRTDSESAWLGFGMTSLVLAYVAMILFFLPILGIPIGAIALVFGIVGLILSPYTSGPSVRWSVLGIGMSLLALGLNLLINFAPQGYLPNRRDVPTIWQPVPDRPYVPPPAKP